MEKKVGKEKAIWKMEIYFSMVNFNGVLNGNIKQFHENGNLFYEGDIKNELMYGKGKEYYENGKLLFEGEYDKRKSS